MPTLTDVRVALAANLATIRNIQASPYLLSNPTPPAIEVQPSEIEYDLAMDRGLDRWSLIVRAFVGISSDKGAQKRLDGMLASSGSQSVKAALESDRTLGGACDDLHVTRCSGYRIFVREGAASLLGAEWEVDVYASG